MLILLIIVLVILIRYTRKYGAVDDYGDIFSNILVKTVQILVPISIAGFLILYKYYAHRELVDTKVTKMTKNIVWIDNKESPVYWGNIDEVTVDTTLDSTFIRRDMVTYNPPAIYWLFIMMPEGQNIIRRTELRVGRDNVEAYDSIRAAGGARYGFNLVEAVGQAFGKR